MTTDNDNRSGWDNIYDPANDPVEDENNNRSDGAAMESLVAGARVNEGTVMDDAVKLTEEQRESIRQRWRAFREEQDKRPAKDRITNRRLARETGQKGSTLSQVLSGKYPASRDGNTDRIDATLRRVDQFIAKYEETSKAPKRTPFAWTKVAEDIRAVANAAVVLRSMGICYGSAGIGKTCTLTALLDQYPGSFLITITDDIRTVKQLFDGIGDTIGVGHSRTCRSTRKLLIEELKGSQRLCMVDEAHYASLKLLNALRQLHDDCKIPMIFVGMPRLARNLMEGRGDDSLGATLDSRIQIAVDLEDRFSQNGGGAPLYSMEDIRKVFSQSQLRIARDAIQWLHDTANAPEDGGLRAAQAALLMAEYIASLATAPETSVITRQALIDASNLLMRRKRAQRVDRDAPQQQRVAQ